MSQQAFALQALPPRSGIGKDAHPPEHQGKVVSSEDLTEQQPDTSIPFTFRLALFDRL